MAETSWLLVIVGTTGSGKTKLSLDLAEALARECGVKASVVSADSMQLYRHIDVLSAKATREEQALVPHHLIDILDVDDASFNVVEYQRLACPLIEQELNASRVPILVGGTNYYIESVLWESLYEFTAPEIQLDDKLRQELEKMDNEALHARLASVDPPRAELLHPNTRRKVLRSLEIYYSTNRRHSDIIQEQQSKPKELRHRTCIFWVHCDSEVLNTRLDSRVDDMISKGLKTEVTAVAEIFKGKEMDWERGALQSIGLREFRPWIESYQTTGNDDAQLFSSAVADVKLHTKQYAKNQVSWIRNSLLGSCTIFRLDSTDPTLWKQKVFYPAFNIVRTLVQSKNPEDNKSAILPSDMHPSYVEILTPVNLSTKPAEPWKKFYCEICTRTLNGQQEWDVHQNSKGHKLMRRKANPKQRQETSSSSSTS